EDPLEFFHPVVRRAVYETLDVVERDAAHRAAAELLLDAGAPPENAAAHLLRVAPQADVLVVSTRRQAAAPSLAHGAADAAVGGMPSQSSTRRSTSSTGRKMRTSTSGSRRSSSARRGGIRRRITSPKRGSPSLSPMRSTEALAATSCSRRWRITR